MKVTCNEVLRAVLPPTLAPSEVKRIRYEQDKEGEAFPTGVYKW